jgi:hypothetical protein
MEVIFMARKKNEIKDFWEKVEKTESCWLWTGDKDKDGYGRWWFEGRNFRAHRMSLMILGAKIQPEKIVKHNCHNPPCVNPEHLEISTQKENIADQLKRGTHSKLKYPDSVIESIIKDHEELGWGARKLSQKYGVSSSQVSLIITNKSRSIRKEKLEPSI